MQDIEGEYKCTAVDRSRTLLFGLISVSKNKRTISPRILILSFTFGLLVLLSHACDAQDETVCENVAEACKLLKQNYGYGCNGSVEQYG